MRIWIDCEWNDFRGALISMALVDEDGREWYEVLDCYNPSPWVAANVMPVLNKAPTSVKNFQQGLEDWLRPYIGVHIIADWPEDIARFCEALIIGPGLRMNTPPLMMEVTRGEAWSEQPHNALADARAMRAAYYQSSMTGKMYGGK